MSRISDAQMRQFNEDLEYLESIGYTEEDLMRVLNYSRPNWRWNVYTRGSKPLSERADRLRAEVEKAKRMREQLGGEEALTAEELIESLCDQMAETRDRLMAVEGNSVIATMGARHVADMLDKFHRTLKPEVAVR